MAETSRFWTGTTTGDAVDAPYDAPTELAQVLNSISGAAGNSANRGGVIMHELNNLAPTTSGVSPVAINTGRGICYGGWYQNDASLNIAIPTPSVSTRQDYIVLRKTWADQTIRLVRLAGTEGAGPPSITQTIGLVWEVIIAHVSITTGGAITLSDRRPFICADSNKPFVVVWRSTNQSISTGAGGAANISWDTASWESPEDTGMWDVGNPTRLVAPFPGIYVVHANYVWQGAAGGNYRIGRFRLNGSVSSIAENWVAYLAGSQTTGQDFSWRGPLNAGDYMELNVEQDSGGAINFLTVSTERSPRFSMEWIRSRY